MKNSINVRKYCSDFYNCSFARKILNSVFKLIAGSLEAAYSLNWGVQEIWRKGGGQTLALL